MPDTPRDTSGESLRLHRFYQGKMQTMPKCAMRGYEDFAVWYTPGVAACSRAIAAEPDLAFEYTNRANLVAVVSDGTRVLGLGDIGPEAGLPVMEGKALLFKYLAGVDAVALCLATKDADELVRAVKLLEPSFGGINLEDIAQPKCFRVLDELRRELRIPVWHDDQQGTATVALAGLLNATSVVGKRLDGVKIAMIGAGAANVATYRLLKAAGVSPQAIVACDSQGVLHRDRDDIEARQQEFVDKWLICNESNGESVVGGIAETLRGADVCLAFSRPGPETIRAEWLSAMAPNAVVFACANPTPEVWPAWAKEAGVRIVATGRSDFPNQVNNSLVFPGIFRGALDVRARAITDEMSLAVARELARCAAERGIREDYILPRMDEWEVAPRLAVVAAQMAQVQGVSQRQVEASYLMEMASRAGRQAREATQALMEKGLIPPP